MQQYFQYLLIYFNAFRLVLHQINVRNGSLNTVIIISIVLDLVSASLTKNQRF